MNTCRTRPGPAVSRRTLVTAAGAGAATLALGRVGFTTSAILAQGIQIGDADATPTTRSIPTPAPPAGETVQDVVARLGYERDAIVAFAREEILYEPYAGILRGATGTLRARAGNSVDQAVLLSALLDAAQIEHRFASGPLDPASERMVNDQVRRTRDDVQAARDAADAATLMHLQATGHLPSAPPPLDPAIEQQMEEAQASARLAVDTALAAAEASLAAVGEALASVGIGLPALSVEVPESERQWHTWVQISDGPDWVDINPCLPEGTVMPAVAETLEALPDDWYQWLRFIIAADEWRSGSVRQREVVSLTAASARLVDVPVALSMASAGELSEVGQTVTRGLTGQKTIYPSIYADGVVVNATTPLLFATDAADGNPFGDAPTPGLGEGETVTVWLRVEITSPGAEMVVIERPLLDRVPPEDRATGTVAPERVQPLQVVPTEIGDDTPEQFSVVTIIHTDVARIPLTDALVRYSQDEVFGALGVLGPAMSGLRDMLGATLEAEAGFWTFPSAPNLTVFHAGAPDAHGQATLIADLLHRARTSLPLVDVTPASDAHPLVLSGALDAVAEQLLLAPETRNETGENSSVEVGPTIVSIFAEAATAGVPVRILSGADNHATIDADPLSHRWMESALAAGQVVIVPETPVQVNGTPVLGWWIVDPATGRTRDQLSTGMAGASTSIRVQSRMLFGNTSGWTFLLRAIAWLKTNAKHFVCLGGGIMWGAIFARRAMREHPVGDAENGNGALGLTAEDLVAGGVGGGSVAVACYMAAGG